MRNNNNKSRNDEKPQANPEPVQLATKCKAKNSDYQETQFM